MPTPQRSDERNDVHLVRVRQAKVAPTLRAVQTNVATSNIAMSVAHTRRRSGFEALSALMRLAIRRNTSAQRYRRCKVSTLLTPNPLIP